MDGTRNSDTRPQQDLKAVLTENMLLQKQFAAWGLDIDAISAPEWENPQRMNWYLRTLAEWVQAYREHGSRPAMEAKGYQYPPVDPCMDPDSDWSRFERWIKHEPLTWNLADKVREWDLSSPLDDDETKRRIAMMIEMLAGCAVVVDLNPGVPPRLVYDYLLRTLLTEQFDHDGPGTVTHLTGCSGYCPGCFQRPWCDLGAEEEWPEDEEAGRMVCPAGVARGDNGACDEAANG